MSIQKRPPTIKRPPGKSNLDLPAVRKAIREVFAARGEWPRQARPR
jgi:hypothetical protein